MNTDSGNGDDSILTERVYRFTERSEERKTRDVLVVDDNFFNVDVLKTLIED